MSLMSNYGEKVLDLLKEIDSRMKLINKIRPFEGAYLKQINEEPSGKPQGIFVG